MKNKIIKLYNVIWLKKINIIFRCFKFILYTIVF